MIRPDDEQILRRLTSSPTSPSQFWARQGFKRTGVLTDKVNMAIQMICPNLKCRKILSVPDDVRGKHVQCQYCQTTFRVPESQKKPVAPAAK